MAFFLMKSTPHNQAPLNEWKDGECKLFEQHVQYWHGLMAGGNVHLFGRVDDPENPFSIAVIEADGAQETDTFIAEDPGRSLYDFTCHPMTHVQANKSPAR